jgi:hypothetical protein
MEKQKEQAPRLAIAPPMVALIESAHIEKKRELRSGDLCPQCKSARLDYDGLLNLSCPQCGFAAAGCYT